MSPAVVHLVVLIIVLLPMMAVYFIPAIVAYSKHKVNRAAILAVNFFLGWTFVGWVVALFWALKVDAVDRPPQ